MSSLSPFPSKDVVGAAGVEIYKVRRETNTIYFCECVSQIVCVVHLNELLLGYAGMHVRSDCLRHLGSIIVNRMEHLLLVKLVRLLHDS
jgi:hypothetical protein